MVAQKSSGDPVSHWRLQFSHLSIEAYLENKLISNSGMFFI